MAVWVPAGQHEDGVATERDIACTVTEVVPVNRATVAGTEFTVTVACTTDPAGATVQDGEFQLRLPPGQVDAWDSYEVKSSHTEPHEASAGSGALSHATERSMLPKKSCLGDTSVASKIG